MSRWLPPAGGGYSGRSAISGRFVKQSTVKKSPKTTIKENAPRVKPKSRGSAGVSRAK